MKTSFERKLKKLSQTTLYDPSFEHDSCGVGFVANIHGVASRETVERAIECVINLTHRGAIGADAKIVTPPSGAHIDELAKMIQALQRGAVE